MIKIDWKKVAVAAILSIVLTGALAGPAYAFDQAASTVTKQICSAYTAGKTVLISAAVLALIIGLAPMLWGQIKVKWIISCLVACVLFGLTNTIVNAFAGTSGC